MEKFEYQCIRISMIAVFDGTKTHLKVYVSTDDAITPNTIQYSYKMIFEDKHIHILSYNLETIIRRHALNSRMRDFYDIYILNKLYESEISNLLLKEALEKTSKTRGRIKLLENTQETLNEIENNEYIKKLLNS